MLTGVCFAGLGWFVSRTHVDVSAQQLNLDLAARIVDDNKLIYASGDMINVQALNATFDRYMTINPAIEIYQLSADGNIVGYSTDPDNVKRARVDLNPVRALLNNTQALPILGDDPKGRSRKKIFSATLLSPQMPELGYLYVILRGHDADVIDRAFGDSYFFRTLVIALAVSIGFGLLGSLLVFRLLGRRLESLAYRMNHFASVIDQPASTPRGPIDEITTLESNFDAMSVRIREQMENLERVDHKRREFVAQVSHDLRTPLTVINTLVESLSLRYDRLDDSKKLEYIQTVRHQGNSLSRLVEDLFSLARLEYDDDDNAREPLAIGDLIQDVVHKHTLSCEEAGLRLLSNCPPSLPWIAGDIGLLERLLDNLIINAIAHSEAPGEICIDAQADGDRVAITIGDNGPGIAQADRDRIFEDGYKGDTSTGAGFGLCIARRVAHWHGGTLALVDSTRGAKFRISLPTP